VDKFAWYFNLHCTCTQVDYDAMMAALGEACKEMQIQPVQCFLDKVRRVSWHTLFDIAHR
jgi:hypothetical protein